MFNIPNCITLFRIALIPVLVVLYYMDIKNHGFWVALVFVLAAVSDWFDGYLARKLNMTSALGAFLDPVADKLIVSSALVLLATDMDVIAAVWHVIPFTVAICIIIGREIVVSSLREWMAEMGERGVVSVGYLGKVKTTFQMIAIAWLLYAEPFWGISVLKLGELMLYVAAILTVWSMVIYLRAASPYLRK